MSHVEQQQLKNLVESGSYRPVPELVAEAMLSRRSVRALLTGSPSFSPTGRIHSAAESRPQAA